MKPMIMGAVMAPMMLLMLHGQLTAETSATTWAAILFIGAHVALALAALALALFAARLSPALRQQLLRLHRPSLGHVGQMLAGMVLSAASLHLIIHGGIA